MLVEIEVGLCLHATTLGSLQLLTRAGRDGMNAE